MGYKKVDPDAPRCPACNEPLTKADLRDLNKNGGICCWCHGWNDVNRYSLRGYYECEMSTWLNRLRMNDLPLRSSADRTYASDLRKNEL